MCHLPQLPSVTIPVVLPLDLSDLDSLPGKAEEALEVFGKVDVLVNNGGISHRSCVLDTSLTTHQKIMDVNYFGAVLLTKCKSGKN